MRVTHEWVERSTSVPPKLPSDPVFPVDGEETDGTNIIFQWSSSIDPDGAEYEDIYLKNYATVMELNRGLDQYFCFYNNERFHQSLDYRTPVQVYYDCQRATDG